MSAQQWRDRLYLQYGWDLQGLPEKCDGFGKRFSTANHALMCLKGGLVGWGHNQFRDVIGEFSRAAWNNCGWEPVVREASERARDGGSDGLRADFVVRGMWEPDRDCFLIPELYMLAALDVQPSTSLTRMPSIPLPGKR